MAIAILVPGHRLSTLQKRQTSEKDATLRRLAKQAKGQLPRTIDPEQRQALIKALENAPKGKVHVLTLNSELEQVNFMKQLTEVLTAAGYDAEPMIGSLWAGAVPISGLTMRVKHDPFPAHAMPLRDALNSVLLPSGISCELEVGSKFPPDRLQLFIGAKPIEQ
jgi:hypothetical protein